MYPKVSIVIPFYNDPYIPQALASALAQTYPNVEVIVVDDGSDRYSDLIGPYTGRIHYIGKANGGTASALNYGIRLATGHYVAWLSSDDLFYPHKLSLQIPFMIDRQASISFSAFDQIDAHTNVTGRHLGPRFSNYGTFVRSLMLGDPINGCTVVAKRDLLVGFGLFDENLRYTQDYDLWVRMIVNGVHFHYLDQPLIQYRWHANMGTERHRAAISQEVQFIQGKYGALLDAEARRHGG